MNRLQQYDSLLDALWCLPHHSGRNAASQRASCKIGVHGAINAPQIWNPTGILFAQTPSLTRKHVRDAMANPPQMSYLARTKTSDQNPHPLSQTYVKTTSFPPTCPSAFPPPAPPSAPQTPNTHPSLHRHYRHLCPPQHPDRKCHPIPPNTR